MSAMAQTPTPLEVEAQKAAAALVRRYPKIDASPESMRGLVGIFRHTKAGGRTFTKSTPREGQYLPTHTRAAAAELETLVAFAKNPHISRIQVIPSRSGQRTPDFVFHLPRGGIGRFEVTTATGAKRGYQAVGGPGTPASDVDAVVASVRRKIRGNSQLAVKFNGVPRGGTLVVHLPRGGTEAVVKEAMDRLKDELKSADFLHAIQFVLPESHFTSPAERMAPAKGTPSRPGTTAPLYIRERQGTYGLAPTP
jgi:hypothetical protein